MNECAVCYVVYFVILKSVCCPCLKLTVIYSTNNYKASNTSKQTQTQTQTQTHWFVYTYPCTIFSATVDMFSLMFSCMCMSNKSFLLLHIITDQLFWCIILCLMRFCNVLLYHIDVHRHSIFVTLFIPYAVLCIYIWFDFNFKIYRFN